MEVSQFLFIFGPVCLGELQSGANWNLNWVGGYCHNYWSDGVIGPGLRWVFRYALLFVSAMSVFCRVLAVTLVSKKGPICLHLSVSINVTICCPRKLLVL